MMYKLKFTAIVFAMGILSIVGQEEQYNNMNELAKMVQIPNSPEAEAFTKYGNTAVSLYTGVPNVGLPLYTYQGRELDIPLSLTYDASGVKVEQMASQIGLGWNLQVGGRISRVVNGFPDDYNHANPAYHSFFNDKDNLGIQTSMLAYINENSIFNSDPAVRDYFDFIKKVSTNEYETQPDYFSLNVLGIDDYIVINVSDLEAKTLKNPRISVEILKTTGGPQQPISITGWIVTHEDGTKFHFTLAEETIFQGDDYITGPDQPYGWARHYNSSWLLTKIESANKKDIYDFNYVDLGSWAGDNIAAPVQHMTNNADDSTPGPNFYPNNYGNSATYLSTYHIDQLFLSEIWHNSKKIVSMNLGPRPDADPDSAIERINVHLPDVTETVLKYFDFFHSSFGDPNDTFQFDKRLKLDSLKIYSSNNNQYQHYGFEYESSDLVPSRASVDQDYLGLYNKANNPGQILYPKIKIGEDTYDGANRNPDINYAKIGNLKKLIYPTGGYTEFEYELHATPYEAEDLQNETMVEVDFAGFQLLGGVQQADFYVPNLADCSGIWCQDQYIDPPNVSQNLFHITEDGLYDILYQSTGGTTQFPKYGYLYYHGQGTCSAFSTVDLDQLIDLSNGQALNPDNMVLSANGSYQGTVFLKAGCYQVSMINGTHGNTSTFSVFGEVIQGGSTQVGTGQEARAGLRIKSIKDFSENGKLAIHKEYQYTTELDGNTSSGRIIHRPYLSYITNQQVFMQPSQNNGNSGVYNLKLLNRIGHSSGGSRPHIAYGKVFEIFKSNTIDPNISETNQRNGYNEYTFYNEGNGPESGSGIYTTGLPPFGTYFIQNYEVGKEKDIVAKTTNGTSVTANRFVYEDHLYYLNKGIFLENESGNTFKYVKVVPTTGGFTYQFEDAVFTCLAGNPAPGQGAGDCWNQLVAQPCLDQDCINDISLARNVMRITTAGGRVGNTIQTTNQVYNSNTPVTTVTSMEYDQNVSWQLRKSTLTGSDGETSSVQYYYPQDDPTTYASHIAKNRLTDIVKMETLENSNVVFTRENEYFNNTDVLAPSKIRTKKGSQAFDDRANIQYYTNGNVQETYAQDGSHTVYLWGYDNKYLVAKIDNATYTQIESLPNFGSNFTLGSGGLSVAQESTLRTHSSLEQAMVTTYTYKPMIGLDTVTDPRGYVMRYVYDEFNRLKEVRDEQDNIVSDYLYNYKTQQ
ncbi:hypothetical protein [Flagellimonas sp.]|uniref:hypothetical protein n=1 Tax=Flagellimonas sp. TaxID=2058762 RepID=UPI003BB01786